MRRNWEKLTDEEILDYGRKHGYAKMNCMQLKIADGSYLFTLYKRKLVNMLIKIKFRKWQDMTDDEILEYGRKHGYDGLDTTELQEKDSGYMRILYARGLDEKILKTTSRKFNKMSDEEILAYGRENKYVILFVAELHKLDQSYYNILRKRGLVDLLLKRKINKRIIWSRMTDEEILDYGKEHGYQDTSPRELERKDRRYYDILWKRNLTKKILRSERKDWKLLTDEEILKYGIEHGYNKFTRINLQKNHGDFYMVLRKRRLLDQFNKSSIRKRRFWNIMSDEEIIEYGVLHGYVGLSPTELLERDQKYYQNLVKRELIDKIAVRKFINEKSFLSMLKNDELTKLVIEKLNGNLGDVADVLTVVNNGLNRDRIITYFEDPSIRSYLGKFAKGIRNISDLQDLAANILPFDNKEGALKELLTRKFMDYRRRKLGNRPGREQREEFLEELEGSIFG